MKHVVGLLVAMAVIISGLIGMPSLASAQEGSSNVTPGVGPAGARFAFFADGFDKNEQVGVWLNTPDGKVMDAKVEQLNSANEDGRADWFWRAPTDAQLGTWQMVARGVDSEVQSVISFQIASGELPAQDANVTPNVGPAGARFAFFASGFDKNEEVGVWLNAPDGSVMDADVEELDSANEDGRADWFWTAPTNAQPGMWQMVARGADSEVQSVISFEIR